MGKHHMRKIGLGVIIGGMWIGMWVDWNDRATRERTAIMSCILSQNGSHLEALAFCEENLK